MHAAAEFHIFYNFIIKVYKNLVKLSAKPPNVGVCVYALAKLVGI